MKKKLLTETNEEYQSRMDGYRNENLAQNKPYEEMFKELLDKNDIFYIRESKKFTNTDDIHRCYFMDFYIPYYGIDIEIDGIEHTVSQKRKKMDLVKEKYFEEEKNITTLRISNKSVCEMSKKGELDWNAVFSSLPNEKLKEIEDKYRKKEKSWKWELSRYGVDTEREIFFYYSLTDKFYHYNNLIELRRAIPHKCKKILRYIDREAKSGRAQYFISCDEDLLRERVLEWKKKYKNRD